jgi:hypothetical protein
MKLGLPSVIAVNCGVFKFGARARTSLGSIVWVSLFLTLAFASKGYSVPINILDAQYTTAVFLNGTASSSRTQTSPVPMSDSLYEPNYPDDPTMAIANAGLLGISARTTALPLHGPPAQSSAFAESDLWFSPLTSQTTTINIQLNANFWLGGNNFTAGNVSLLDVTSGNELWNYAWGSWGVVTYGGPSGMNDGTPFPWDTGNSHATLTLDTDLNGSDTYELIMRTGSNAATDAESESIQLLSGLEPVPEPSTFALISLGAVVWLTLHRRYHASARGARRATSPAGI